MSTEPSSRRPAHAVGRAVLIAALAALAVAGAWVIWTREEPPEGTVAVTMYDNGYSPPRVRIPAGGRVIFRNAGRNQHHAVALDESWSTEASFGSLVMEPGDEAEVVFERAGVYPYYCTYHGSPHGDRGMVGKVLVGGAEDDGGPAERRRPVAAASGGVRRVPQDHPRIQQAVDAAEPGDLVLVDRGVWREEVRITTPSIVLRGVDRNETVLDGGFLFGSGVLVLADGVAVENMTARNYLLNGFYWTGATGFRASYLTAHDNGDYGIYAFDSTDGLIERSWASGSPDGGFYVGQCYPCRTVIREVIAEGNGLGYSGTNAGGELWIVSSIFRRNMAGIVPNTLDTELLPPQRETAIVANLVEDNDNREAPGKGIVWPAFGTGILVAGGVDNRIERNVVVDHAGYGILVLPSADANFWPASGNRIEGNTVFGSGRADLAVGSPGTPGNCFAGNRFGRDAPPLLEELQGCSGPRLRLAFDVVPSLLALHRQRQAARGEHPHGDSSRSSDRRSGTRGVQGSDPLLHPPLLQPLPGGAEAPVVPAVGVYDAVVAELESAGFREAPLPPEAQEILRQPRERRRRGAHYADFAAVLPVMLWIAWTLAALSELVRGARTPSRPALSRPRRLAWLAAVVALPVLGALAFLSLGPTRSHPVSRAMLVGGGALLYAGLVVLALLA